MNKGLYMGKVAHDYQTSKKGIGIGSPKLQRGPINRTEFSVFHSAGMIPTHLRFFRIGRPLLIPPQISRPSWPHWGSVWYPKRERKSSPLASGGPKSNDTTLWLNKPCLTTVTMLGAYHRLSIPTRTYITPKQGVKHALL